MIGLFGRIVKAFSGELTKAVTGLRDGTVTSIRYVDGTFERSTHIVCFLSYTESLTILVC